MADYEKAIVLWQNKKIRTDAELAEVLALKKCEIIKEITKIGL